MLRLIDANFNRASEGLRLLEDVARFLLDDVGLSEQLKSLRHSILGGDLTFQRKLLLARDSVQDVGAFAPVPDELKREDLPAIVIANARRAQESLRVLEEFAKLPGQSLDSAIFKKARFDIYEIERKLTAALIRQDKRNKISGVYLVLDYDALAGRDEAEVAGQALSGGVKMIQLRDKNRERREVLATALKLREVCSQFGALFIINDYLDIALASDADGLHLGQKDLPLAQARRLLPLDKILGCSAKSPAQALQAQAEGADYVAVGAMYPTRSKAGAIIVGLDMLRQVRAVTTLPVVAIGGINEGNAAQVIEAGADSVAVISAIMGAENVEEAARKLAAKIGEA